MGGIESADEAIFASAVDVPAEQRAEYLDRACGGDSGLRMRVEGLLLANDRLRTFMRQSPADLLVDPSCAPPSSTDSAVADSLEVGSSIGRYQLIEKLGEGGCGSVFLARQVHPIRRDVALKVIKLGMDTRSFIARFERERQALAMMEHPSIAKLYDAGATATGRPYLVMELIRGTRITHYCDEQCLCIEDRLQLILQVCGAIQHAHQRGIIHRDIKPSNLLISTQDGVAVPKVIDFGIAKAMQDKITDHTSVTAGGQVVGTPAYMSPEQAALCDAQVDTRSDIYSLGVVLYELLAGRLPFDVDKEESLDAIRNRIRHQEPPSPSQRLGKLESRTLSMTADARKIDPATLSRSLQRDLDWIVLKCLEKEPARRYESASELAADIRRYLSDQPVLARPPSTAYRLRKTYRRHRIACVAGLAVLLSLLLGIAASTRQAIRADRARNDAVAAQLRADQLRRSSEEQGQTLRRNLYAAQMNLASQSADYPSGLPRVQNLLSQWAHNLPDLRGWEWYHLAGLTRQDQMTLGGHLPSAWDVSWAPAGRYLAVASLDRRAYVWDTFTGNRALVLSGATDQLETIAWSPDGTRIAAGGKEPTVRIWDARSGDLLVELAGHANRVEALAWSPDSRRLVSGSQDNSALVWDAATGKMIKKLSLPQGWVRAAAWSPDGRWIAANVRLADVPSIYLFDAYSFEEVKSFSDQVHKVRCLTFSPDSQKLASSGNERLVKVWDLATSKQLLSLSGHSSFVQEVDWSPDGSKLVSCSDDTTVRVWDSTSGRSLATYRGHLHSVQSVAWSPDGSQIASACQNGSVKLWDPTGRAETGLLKGHTGEVQYADWNRDNTRLATTGPDSLRVWDAASQSCLWSIQQPFRTPAWSVDGTKLAVGTGSNKFLVFDGTTGKQLHEVETDGFAHCLAWSPDGKAIAVGQSNGKLRIRDAATFEIIHQIDAHAEQIMSLSWRPDGKRLASGSLDQLVKIWDTESGKQLHELRADGYQVRCVRWSPDGNTLASANFFQTVSVWDPETGALRSTLRGQSGVVEAIAWSPDSMRLAASGWEGTVKIWLVPTATELLTLFGHAGPVLALDWSRDGSQIASCDAAGSVIVRDATRGYALEGAAESLAPLTRQIERRSDNLLAVKQRAAVYAELGDWQNAAADAEKYLAQVRSDPTAWFAAGPWVNVSSATSATSSDQSPRIRGIVRDDGQLDLGSAFGDSADAVASISLRVYAPSDKQVQALIRWNGPVTARINDTAAAAVHPQAITTGPSEQLVPMTLSAGWNTLLIRAERPVGASDQDMLMLLQIEPSSPRHGARP